MSIVLILCACAIATPSARAIEIYVTPSEHDDRLHVGTSAGANSIWRNLEEAAGYLHNHVLPALEADRSRRYVIGTVYTLRMYPDDEKRV